MSNSIGRFRSSQGSIELFTLEGRAAIELLASNPLAGFCLALNDVFHDPPHYAPLTAIQRYVHRPQCEILGWLGFKPATEAVAKVGRKCIPEALTVERCRRLRTAWSREPVRALLAHVPRINAGVIALITAADLEPYLTPQLVTAVGQSTTEDQTETTAPTLRDIHEMRAVVRIGTPPPRIASLPQLRQLHDRLVRELNRPGLIRPSPDGFPRPPFPAFRGDGLEVYPLTSLGAVQAMDRELHTPSYCSELAAYIRDGRIYICRVVLNGEQFGLILSRESPASPWMGVLVAKGGEPASTQSSRIVMDRLSQVMDRDSLLRSEFPPPPVAAHLSPQIRIVPVTTLAALQSFGREQRNCVASYGQRIQAGKTYIYRVACGGKSYCLCIGQGEGGRWEIAELKGVCNSEAPAVVGKHILHWLRNAQTDNLK